MIRRTEVEKQLTKLALQLGYCNEDGKTISESGTETFALDLLEACRHTKREIEKSHRQGLCLDGITVIAEYMEVSKKVR